MAKRPPARNPGMPLDPDANWNDTPGDHNKAIEQGERIIDLIDEAPEHVADRAADFFSDVRDKVASVMETIERSKRVSDKQQSALDNWEDGVKRWLNPRDSE